MAAKKIQPLLLLMLGLSFVSLFGYTANPAFGSETDEENEETTALERHFLAVGGQRIFSTDEADRPIPISYGDTVTGRTSGIPHHMHLWLVVHPHQSSGFYPQQTEIFPLPPKNKWTLSVFVGTPDEGQGEQFDLLLVLVDKEGDQFFRDYIIQGKEFGIYKEEPLPSGTTILDSIRVIRKN